MYAYSFFFFFFIGSLNIRKTLRPLAPYCLMSSNLGAFLFYACIFIAMCCHVLSLFFMFIFIPSFCLNTCLLSSPSSSLFFRLILSPFLFIIPRVGKFMLLWACPWRLSLTPLLLLHKGLLPRLQFLHPNPFLPRRVLRLRWLVSLFPNLLRSPLPRP